ncbi:2OG-Fe(II) oxygenase [Vibrio olivae]|uniref:2OG-Fe(II) oxygenase n=1 Tax=Vibrio olivae TaxID=1243002 RepID=A0ABV5HI84_9VIBR
MDALIDALFTQGYYVWDDFLAPDQVDSLNLDMPEAWQAARIGRHDDLTTKTSVRSDNIQWLSAEMGKGVQAYLTLMETIRLAVNRHLYLGLFEYEAHFAKYAIGDCYQKHFDSFHGATNRRLTTVLYLNQDWQLTDGGELVIYQSAPSLEQSTDTLETLLPKSGRLVVFLSEKFAHQVNVAKRERYSIAGWFRVNGVTENQLDISR